MQEGCVCSHLPRQSGRRLWPGTRTPTPPLSPVAGTAKSGPASTALITGFHRGRWRFSRAICNDKGTHEKTAHRDSRASVFTRRASAGTIAAPPPRQSFRVIRWRCAGCFDHGIARFPGRWLKSMAPEYHRLLGHQFSAKSDHDRLPCCSPNFIPPYQHHQYR